MRPPVTKLIAAWPRLFSSNLCCNVAVTLRKVSVPWLNSSSARYPFVVGRLLTNITTAPRLWDGYQAATNSPPGPTICPEGGTAGWAWLEPKVRSAPDEILMASRRVTQLFYSRLVRPFWSCLEGAMNGCGCECELRPSLSALRGGRQSATRRRASRKVNVQLVYEVLDENARPAVLGELCRDLRKHEDRPRGKVILPESASCSSFSAPLRHSPLFGQAPHQGIINNGASPLEYQEIFASQRPCPNVADP